MRIAMVAGEASGDALGAGLIKAIRALNPAAVFEGVGGPQMQALGFQTLADMDRLSVMGFVEPLGRLPELLSIKRMLVRRYTADPPDVFVGIDSPGFNLRLERDLHRQGIRIVHYVSPTVWAWGKGRIRTIAESVDRLLALLPFEVEIYHQHGIDARFVGHPLADRIPLPETDQEIQDRKVCARKVLLLPDKAPVVALMPGSRAGEIQRLAPDFLHAACLVRAKKPDAVFLVPCANADRKRQIESLISSDSTLAGLEGSLVLLEGRSHEVLKAADVVLLASGTATLESMLLRRPMVVCYRMAPLSWLLASRLVNVPHVALPNLLAGRRLVPEYLQGAVRPRALANDVLRLLDDRKAVEDIQKAFAGLHSQLQCNADASAAQAVLELIGDRGA